MNRLAALTTAAIIFVAPASAHAGAFDVFGYGARAISLGGAMTASCEGHSAVYYNPAALSRAQHPRFATDFYIALPSLDLKADTLADPSYAPEEPPVHNGAGIGGVFPIAGSLHFGFSAQVPLDKLLSVELLDPQIPQWYRYDALPGKIQLAAAVAYPVAPGLHLGVGAQSLATMDGGAALELDPANQAINRRDLGLELIHTAALTAGILYEPVFAEGLRVGLSFRDSMQLEFALPIVFDLGQALELTIGATGITLYTPQQFSAGFAWDMTATSGLPVLFTADVTWARWSQAPRPSVDFYLDLEGDLVEDLGAEDLLDFRVGTEPKPAFQDTVTARGGVQWAPWRQLILRGGYSFRPSALSGTSGFSNYVDTDAHLISLGAGTEVSNPLQAQARPLSLALATQVTLLKDVSVQQDRPGPVGDFSGGGQILTIALTAQQAF